MNEAVNFSAVCEMPQTVLEPVKKSEIMPVLENKPDIYDGAKISAGGVIAAGAAGVSGYGTIKGFINFALNGIENEIRGFCTEIGKSFAGIPGILKASLKYGGGALAGIGLFLLSLRDGDKNGKSDILDLLDRFM